MKFWSKNKGKFESGTSSEKIDPPRLSNHIDDWEELAIDYLDGQLSPDLQLLVG